VSGGTVIRIKITIKTDSPSYYERLKALIKEAEDYGRALEVIEGLGRERYEKVYGWLAREAENTRKSAVRLIMHALTYASPDNIDIEVTVEEAKG